MSWVLWRSELYAVAAMIMCLLFIVVDIGRPDRLWHMILQNFIQSLPICAGIWAFGLLLYSFFLKGAISIVNAEERRLGSWDGTNTPLQKS